MDLIKIGTIIKPSGTSGAVLLVDTLPGISLPAAGRVFIGYSESFVEEYSLQADLPSLAGKATLKLNGIDLPEAAANLREKAVFAAREDVLLANPGYVFEEDVLGCEVIDDATGGVIGKVVEVWFLPANDVWLMQSDWGEVPLPVIDDVILKTDFRNKKIWIHLLDGLTDIALK